MSDLIPLINILEERDNVKEPHNSLNINRYYIMPILHVLYYTMHISCIILCTYMYSVCVLCGLKNQNTNVIIVIPKCVQCYENKLNS